MTAPVTFAGLVGPGLYQFNVTVPDVPDGDQPVTAQTAGASTPSGTYITIQR